MTMRGRGRMPDRERVVTIRPLSFSAVLERDGNKKKEKELRQRGERSLLVRLSLPSCLSLPSTRSVLPPPSLLPSFFLVVDREHR